MTAAGKFEALFTPFQLGNLTLPNRVVFPPMGLEVCEGGVPGDEAADYYARRAKGGASAVEYLLEERRTGR